MPRSNVNFTYYKSYSILAGWPFFVLLFVGNIYKLFHLGKILILIVKRTGIEKVCPCYNDKPCKGCGQGTCHACTFTDLWVGKVIRKHLQSSNIDSVLYSIYRDDGRDILSRGMEDQEAYKNTLIAFTLISNGTWHAQQRATLTCFWWSRMGRWSGEPLPKHPHCTWTR